MGTIRRPANTAASVKVGTGQCLIKIMDLVHHILVVCRIIRLRKAKRLVVKLKRPLVEPLRLPISISERKGDLERALTFSPSRYRSPFSSISTPPACSAPRCTSDIGHGKSRIQPTV